PQMVWSTLPDGFHDYYNARWYEFTGAPAGSTDGEAWNGAFHPEDQARALSRWAPTVRDSPGTGATVDLSPAASASLGGAESGFGAAGSTGPRPCQPASRPASSVLVGGVAVCRRWAKAGEPVPARTSARALTPKSRRAI
ncbi:MAG: hypothetical protein K2X45_09955, partial [Phreatobacter sp.]|nr:hypothetical protein [Phreatobacter sp.]